MDVAEIKMMSVDELMPGEMLEPRDKKRKTRKPRNAEPCYPTQVLSLSLEVDLPDDGLGHVLVLPRATVHLLELDTMQAEQWDLDNEDLEAQGHAGAKVTLHMGAGFACGALFS